MDIMTKYEDVKAAKEAAVEVSALWDIVSFLLQVFQGYYFRIVPELRVAVASYDSISDGGNGVNL